VGNYGELRFIHNVFWPWPATGIFLKQKNAELILRSTAFRYVGRKNRRAHHLLPAASLLAPLVASIHKFSPGEQADDITLVVARCRA
jgi:hypothetical protein